MFKKKKVELSRSEQKKIDAWTENRHKKLEKEVERQHKKEAKAAAKSAAPASPSASRRPASGSSSSMLERPKSSGLSFGWTPEMEAALDALPPPSTKAKR